MITRYYHVAHSSYVEGDDLLCRDRLLDEGRAPDWAWADADEGYDGDVVCMYTSLDEAREHLATYGGWLLAIDLDIEDGRVLYPQYERSIMINAEGYPCMPDWIPAEYISIMTREEIGE